MKQITLLMVLFVSIALVSCKDELPSESTNTGVTANLIAWYKLDQNTADSSGHNHNGTPQGGSYVPDRFGNAQSAFSLDGQSFISVPSADELNFDNLSSFSISAWVKTSSTTTGYSGIIAKGPSSGTLPGYAIGMENGKILVQLSGDNTPTIRSSSVINDNHWHMITMTVVANVAAALFIDGQPEGGVAPLVAYPDKDNTGSLFLGKDRTSTNFFIGALDDIYIYGKLLTPNEIFSLYHINSWDGVSGDTTNHQDTSTHTDSSGYGSNTLDNPGFFTTYSTTNYIDGSTNPPWNVAYGSPWYGAGFGADNTPGFIYMWGTSDDGCAVYEPLSTPIKKGHTYRVSAYLKMPSKDLHNTPYAYVRFLAFNQFGSGIPWQTVPGQISSFGSVTVTKIDTWDQYVTADWTADADYDNFEIDVQNANSGPNSETWIWIDNVVLQEKK